MRTPGVLKFGGSTFPDYDAYGLIAEALAGRVHDEERHFAVVVSAMPGETERLRERLTTVNPHPEDASIAGLLTLADTVSAHLLAATPTADWLEYVDWTDAIAAEPVKVANGCWSIPDRPGTGLAWNAQAVARYRIE